MVNALLVMGTSNIVSDIKPDERVIFFPTLGQPTDDGGWKLHIHGLVFEPEDNSVFRKLLLQLFEGRLDLDRADKESVTFRRRAAPFLVDNERGKRAVIQIGDLRFKLAASGPNGHFEDFVQLTADQAKPWMHEGRPAWVKFHAALRPADSRRFEGTVLLLPRTGTSVVSDIDDTIKISEVHDKRKLFLNTSLNPFQPVPGMVEFHSRLAQSNATFHYVSASPWALYEPLAEFCREFGYPDGVFSLIHFRWKDASFFNLMAEAKDKKVPAIESLIEGWPERRFILIGDSGESDPEIYGDVARKYPNQVLWALIRDVKGEDRTSLRMKQAFENVPEERWIIFRDPTELKDRSFP